MKMQCHWAFYVCVCTFLHQRFFVAKSEAGFCFDGINEGLRLNTPILRKAYALSGPECVLHCSNDKCCRSVNYNKHCVSAIKKDNCELLHDVASEKPGELKENPDFNHYKLVNTERQFSCSCFPCPPSEKCVEEQKNCSCAFGFDGDKCVQANFSCGVYNYWDNSDYTNAWSNCPRFSPFMSGLNRTTAEKHSDDTLKSIVGKKCCNITNINATLECKEDLSFTKSFDRMQTWSKCKDGYFINGLYGHRKNLTQLRNIDRAECCKLQGFPETYSDCYEEDVSETFQFSNAGISECSKEKYFIVAFYKYDCNYMHCITKFRCCRMAYT